MVYPTKMEVNGHIYPINTNYKVGLACLKAINDDSLTVLERYLAIETLLLGPDVLEDDEKGLQDKIAKYLRCGKEQNVSESEIDMDYFQDEAIIQTSLRQCYKMTPEEINELSWYEYNDLISGLTEETLLNRIRDIRSKDPSEIKDSKERNRLMKMKESVALRPREHKRTKKEEQSVLQFYKDAQIERK